MSQTVENIIKDARDQNAKLLTFPKGCQINDSHVDLIINFIKKNNIETITFASGIVTTHNTMDTFATKLQKDGKIHNLNEINLHQSSGFDMNKVLSKFMTYAFLENTLHQHEVLVQGLGGLEKVEES